MSFKNQFKLFDCEQHQVLVSKSWDDEDGSATIKLSVNSQHGQIEVSIGGYISDEKRDEMFETRVSQEFVDEMYKQILKIIGEQDEEDDEYRNEKD